MKAVVTGAAGFIGSTLVEALLEKDFQVLGIDSLSDYYSPEVKLRNIESALTDGRYTFTQGDLCELDLAELIPDATYVFHLAGQPGVRKSWGSDFSVYLHDNIAASQAVFEACRTSRRLEKLIYSSSSSIYGQADHYPTSEEDLPSPHSPYGVTKLAAEHLASVYAANFGLPTISLRYFTVYGPRQRPDMAFTRFLLSAVNGDPVTVYGDGEQVRDFTYVGDVVEANLLAAVADVPRGRVFNVAGGTSVSVNQVLDLVCEVTGRPLEVRHQEIARGDVSRTGGDTSLDLSSVGVGWLGGLRITVDGVIVASGCDSLSRCRHGLGGLPRAGVLLLVGAVGPALIRGRRGRRGD